MQYWALPAAFLFAAVTSALADVFDALTSMRPYKDAWPVEEARSYLTRQAGAHFDPVCVAALLRCWDEVREIMRAHPD